MNSDENELASSSTDRANDDSSERNENSSKIFNRYLIFKTNNIQCATYVKRIKVYKIGH